MNFKSNSTGLQKKFAACRFPALAADGLYLVQLVLFSLVAWSSSRL